MKDVSILERSHFIFEWMKQQPGAQISRFSVYVWDAHMFKTVRLCCMLPFCLFERVFGNYDQMCSKLLISASKTDYSVIFDKLQLCFLFFLRYCWYQWETSFCLILPEVSTCSHTWIWRKSLEVIGHVSSSEGREIKCRLSVSTFPCYKPRFPSVTTH